MSTKPTSLGLAEHEMATTAMANGLLPPAFSQLPLLTPSALQADALEVLPRQSLSGEDIASATESGLPILALGESLQPIDAGAPAHQWERQLGDSELSYYLPSRHEGINDMFVHIGFHGPAALFTPRRVTAVWAILRTRHPLLGARIESTSYDDVRFVYKPPESAAAAINSARNNMELRIQSKDDLVNTYLNGPRTLSNDRLSYVVVATPHESADFPFATQHNKLAAALKNLSLLPPMPSLQHFPAANSASSQEFHYLLAAPHCLGDGMALYRMSDEFFELIASDNSDEDLEQLVQQEWERAVASSKESINPIPRPLEERMPPLKGRFAQAVERVDYARSQERLIGGHSFPRPKSKQGPRHIVFPTYAFPPDKSKKVITTCKAHGVSFSHALFALCNIAWARMSQGAKSEQPMMMYSALNLRPYLPSQPAQGPVSDSYWFLSIGYFNVVLPSFFPKVLLTAEGGRVEGSDAEKRIFWHRARESKRQTSKYVGDAMLLARSRAMGRERAARAKIWAREDDAALDAAQKPVPTPPTQLSGSGNRANPATPAVSATTTATTAAAAAAPVQTPKLATPKPPSVALVGLSLLGDLDRVFHHGRYQRLTLHHLTPGSRVRGGGTLLFGYTFAGKLWLNLPWDANGFDRDTIESFWDGLVRGVDELLVK
ncbi:hypothetical protein BKA62DRAFT_706702 [Auriculariales sp. MPI-PUGE-AT-0066]|nr:hypothetical protein BKA62DRAFT_706702 [Auriculariales sp. MPI-PUGE-AT-0066]